MKWFSIALILVLVTGCQRNQYDMSEIYVKYGNGTENVGAVIKNVAGSKVYFGHQSVGNNILSGIELWENETGVQLNITESKDFSSVDESSLIHFRIGSNGDPYSKIDEFVKLVGQIPEKGNPVALFKLCYVDITIDTDVEPLFIYYKEKMLSLKETYPNIRIVACTVPVMGIQKGVKAVIKKILGRQPAGLLDNIKRDEFNRSILSEFQGVMPIFDLGGIESTRPDGSKETFHYKGADYPSMPNFYTPDLGHLNELGSRTLSYNFLAFLAEEVK